MVTETDLFYLVLLALFTVILHIILSRTSRDRDRRSQS
jgi:hypothetical protein